jgi:GTP cyclohydrolase I
MDRERMADGIRRFLAGLGHGFEGDDQERTPGRVARAWTEDLVAGYDRDPDGELTWMPAPPEGGVVMVRGISFASMCVHHLLPFFGEAHVAYLPGERLAGLSKLGRVVDAHARRLQTQEHLTSDIANTLERVLKPRGVIIMLDARHTCMTLRGVRKEQSRMVTTVATGLYDRDGAARAELVGLMTRHGGSATR